jgi:hypothetical protein
MASVQQQVIAQAASRIGYYAPNDPQPGSEAGRYWAAKTGLAWLAGNSRTVWWCMLFVSMCFDKVGQINAIGGFSYNTDVTLNRNRARLVSVANAQPGDVVIFNWNGGGTDHVGIVEKNLGGGRLQTIEGNTSSGAAGAQSSGNGVWRRIRSGYIAGIIRPAYSGSSSNSAASRSEAVRSNAVDEDGFWGPGLTRWLQQHEGTNADGVISGQYRNKWTTPIASVQFGNGGSDLIARMSAKLGITNDPRFIGPTFIARLLTRYNGSAGNGVIDRPSEAIRKMQQRINQTGQW